MNIDLARFERQIALPNIDLDGQEKLQSASVLIIGMGGLGCAVAQSIVGMGIGAVTLVDFDKVEISNLARQPLYSNENVGQAKVNAARSALEQLNPNSKIRTLNKAFDEVTLGDLLENGYKFDVILDCTDNAPTRRIINSQCARYHLPLITAAAIRYEGMVMPVFTNKDAPCYECLTKVWPTPDESCVERGIFTPVVSIIGHYQAMLAGFYLLDLAMPKPGTVQFFDGLNHQWQTLTIQQAHDCEVCAKYKY
jgi:adenylyltransferase/sulfurtransferase